MFGHRDSFSMTGVNTLHHVLNACEHHTSGKTMRLPLHLNSSSLLAMKMLTSMSRIALYFPCKILMEAKQAERRKSSGFCPRLFWDRWLLFVRFLWHLCLLSLIQIRIIEANYCGPVTFKWLSLVQQQLLVSYHSLIFTQQTRSWNGCSKGNQALMCLSCFQGFSKSPNRKRMGLRTPASIHKKKKRCKMRKKTPNISLVQGRQRFCPSASYATAIITVVESCSALSSTSVQETPEASLCPENVWLVR